MDKSDDEGGAFTSAEEASQILPRLLELFGNGKGQCDGSHGYLTSKIAINEIGEDETMFVEAEHHQARLVVHVPMSDNLSKDDRERKILHVLVEFSSTLDAMKTKALVAIYQSLQKQGQVDLAKVEEILQKNNSN